MRKYDYSFLEIGNFPISLINVISGIYILKTKDEARKLGYNTIYTELEKIAKVQSVKESNAIEGIVSTDERINAIVNGNSSPLNHNEQEIAGYRDALNIIHTSYNNNSFDERFILELHNVLLKISNDNQAGHYKSEDNLIIEVNKDGKRSIRFRPVKANEVKENMEQLILAYMDAKNNSKINQLLLVPCVILDFLCIHPFSDGNGRMSRLLTLFLLYKNGFDAGKYISFEEQINKNKASYYDALKKSSENWHENKNNYYYFVENFLITLLCCYKELDKRFLTVNSKKINKTSRIEATILNSLSPISKKEISNILPDVSPTTIEAVLGKMLKDGVIIKVGEAKNTRYIKK